MGVSVTDSRTMRCGTMSREMEPAFTWSTTVVGAIRIDTAIFRIVSKNVFAENEGYAEGKLEIKKIEKTITYLYPLAF